MTGVEIVLEENLTRFHELGVLLRFASTEKLALEREFRGSLVEEVVEMG